MSIGERICLIVVLLFIVVVTIKQTGINDGLNLRLQVIEVQTAVVEERMTTIEVQQVAAVRVDYQEAGVLYCPTGTLVYTTTDGVVNGFGVYCR